LAEDDPGCKDTLIDIALQDVPEGPAVVLALRGLPPGLFGAAGCQPTAAVPRAAAVAVAAGLLPWGLAFAAGAMLHAVSHEAFPGTHPQGNARPATAALVLGFVLLMMLDSALAAGLG
jgi:ZIP family zinc transporter